MRSLLALTLLTYIWQPCPPGHWWRTCVPTPHGIICLCDNDFMPHDAYLRAWLPLIGAE